MVRFESTPLPYTFSIFPWKPAQHDDAHCTVDSEFNSLNNGNSRAATAETHLTITQSSYVTQSQSKHAQHTHTGRESQWPTLLCRVCGERCQIKKLKNVERGRTLEAWERNDGWNTTARVWSRKNFKAVERKLKRCSQRMWKEQKVKARRSLEFTGIYVWYR